MAKVRKNIIIQGLSGDLGKQLRIRTGKISGRTNVFAKFDFETEREDSPAQQAHKQAIREAAAYAHANKGNPIYIAKAKSKKGKERQPYNVAMADWFHPPRILEIDLRGWRGAADQVIRILAVDDVQVAGVRIEISDETGAVVEAGEAIQNYTQWWEYAVQGAMRGERSVTVFASDLPGHVTQASASKKLPG
jgi:hypothetical protein